MYQKSTKIDKQICCEKSIFIEFSITLSILSKKLSILSVTFVMFKYVSFNDNDNFYN